MSIDLTPILNPLIEMTGLVLSCVATWAGVKIAQHFGVKVSQERVNQFQSALEKTNQAGAVALEHLAAEKGWDHPEVKSAIANYALSTIINKFPEAIKAVGLDPTTADGRTKLRQAIERALPAAVTSVATSPATTNGPALTTPASVITPINIENTSGTAGIILAPAL